MKRKVLLASIRLAVTIGSIAAVPLARAEANDNLLFTMVKSAGAASCIRDEARGRVSISDLGPVQNMHVEVFALPPKTDFTLFITTTPNAPFAPAWYQGDLTTDDTGRGVLDVTGIFNNETFIVNTGGVPVEMDHLGMWFADPIQAGKAGCPEKVTPFDGDHNAGIQVLNTSNFPDANGPLLRRHIN